MYKFKWVYKTQSVSPYRVKLVRQTSSKIKDSKVCLDREKYSCICCIWLHHSSSSISLPKRYIDDDFHPIIMLYHWWLFLLIIAGHKRLRAKLYSILSKDSLSVPPRFWETRWYLFYKTTVQDHSILWRNSIYEPYLNKSWFLYTSIFCNTDHGSQYKMSNKIMDHYEGDEDEGMSLLAQLIIMLTIAIATVLTLFLLYLDLSEKRENRKKKNKIKTLRGM